VSGQVDIQLRRSGTIYVIDVKGEMDLFNSSKLKDVVKALIDRNVRDFVVNLEALEYMDSSGIGALLWVYSELRKRGLALLITNPRGSVKRVIELTKLNGYLPIAAGLAEAVSRLRDHRPPQTGGQAHGTSQADPH
jgi:anti-sigma B factor antagonist